MMTPFEWVVGDSSKDHTVTALPPTAAQPPRYTTLRGTTPPSNPGRFTSSRETRTPRPGAQRPSSCQHHYHSSHPLPRCHEGPTDTV